MNEFRLEMSEDRVKDLITALNSVLQQEVDKITLELSDDKIIIVGVLRPIELSI